MLPVVNVCGRGEGVTGAAFGAWVTVGRRQPTPHRRRLADKKRDRRAPCAPPDNDMTLWPLGVIRSRLASFRLPHVIYAGDKDNINGSLKAMFYKAMKMPVLKDLPEKLF